MEFFNEELSKALHTGNYICNKCGTKMYFEDEEVADTLICPHCGHSVDLEFYGLEEEEAYDKLYPLKEDICNCDECVEEFESYEEVCGELNDD